MQCWVRMECRESGCKSLVGQLQEHKRSITVVSFCHVLIVSLWARNYCQIVTRSYAADPIGMYAAVRKLPTQTIRCTACVTRITRTACYHKDWQAVVNCVRASTFCTAQVSCTGM
jgi:hypothetical protein